MDCEATDRAALYTSLLAMRVCPNRRCVRADLMPVALCDAVWGCPACEETWHLPTGTEEIEQRGLIEAARITFGGAR